MPGKFSAICGAVTCPGAVDWDRWRDGDAVIAKRRVEYDDLVILFESHQSMQFAIVKPGIIWSSKKGHFHHDDFVGVEYGSMVRARKGVSKSHRPKPGDPIHAGWIVLMHPSPDLWTLSLNHRTQILYDADIAMILLHLEVRPGAVIFESGTGSCSLSTSIANAIAPTGHLYTFEFNEERFASARHDLQLMKVDHIATCIHRNVIADGFAIADRENIVADAVFLDLPAPWDAVHHADGVLRPFGKICSFSPCMEQVQRTCQVLRSLGFIEIITLECLRRTFDAVVTQFPQANFASFTKDDGTAVAKVSTKRQRRGKTEPADGVLVSKSFASMRGHTGFLTFARKPLPPPSLST